MPNELAKKKDGPQYRYVAIREPMRQTDLPGLDLQLRVPFQTMDFGRDRYKLSAIVTNRDLPADKLIWWCRERCRNSEEAHALMKRDLACRGKVPIRQIWGEHRLVADDGFGVEPQLRHEKSGVGWKLGEQAFQGNPVLVDQPTGSCDGTFQRTDRSSGRGTSFQ